MRRLIHADVAAAGKRNRRAQAHRPPTRLEKTCPARAGLTPYSGPFDLHYLRAMVAPSFPLWLLEYGAVAVFLVNVAIYTRRFATRYAQSHRPAH